MGNDRCQTDVSANLEGMQTVRAWFWSDPCFFQHRSVYPGLDSKLSFPVRSTRECHNFLLFTCDVTFDARLLHSYHVASVEAHDPVNLIDGAVCADSVLVAA